MVGFVREGRVGGTGGGKVGGRVGEWRGGEGGMGWHRVV